jgi:hypothetical protein
MGGLHYMHIGELFGKSPEALAELLLWVLSMRNGARLVFIKLPKQLKVVKEADGKSETIELDY